MTRNRKGLSASMARGRKSDKASACSSPWLITPRAAPSTPSTVTSSVTRRRFAAPASLTGPSSTLLSCLSLLPDATRLLPDGGQAVVAEPFGLPLEPAAGLLDVAAERCFTSHGSRLDEEGRKSLRHGLPHVLTTSELFLGGPLSGRQFLREARGPLPQGLDAGVDVAAPNEARPRPPQLDDVTVGLGVPQRRQVGRRRRSRRLHRGPRPSQRRLRRICLGCDSPKACDVVASPPDPRLVEHSDGFPRSIDPSSEYDRNGRKESSAASHPSSSIDRRGSPMRWHHPADSSTSSVLQVRTTFVPPPSPSTDSSTVTDGSVSVTCRLRQPSFHTAPRPAHRALVPVSATSAASAKLDLPEPLRPTTSVKPGPGCNRTADAAEPGDLDGSKVVARHLRLDSFELRRALAVRCSLQRLIELGLPLVRGQDDQLGDVREARRSDALEQEVQQFRGAGDRCHTAAASRRSDSTGPVSGGPPGVVNSNPASSRVIAPSRRAPSTSTTHSRPS